MAQVEQKAEYVIWNRAVAQLPVLPGTVGNLTATRRGGHRQAQRLAAVAEFFSGHKVFQVRSAGRNATQDATSLRENQSADNLLSIRTVFHMPVECFLTKTTGVIFAGITTAQKVMQCSLAL